VTPTTRPRPSPSEPAKPSLVIGTRKPRPICPRIVMYAVEKFGKTSLFAYAPDPIILMPASDTGYDTLLSAGRVPQVPAEVIETWESLNDWLDALIADRQGRRTIFLDGIGGFERLCHDYVCRKHFGGDWSEKGFLSYNKGYDQSVTDWLLMLGKLDKLNQLGCVIVLTGHAKTKAFNDPMGPAYDRYICDCHEKTWMPTARWSDCILFGKFFTIVDVARQESKKNVAERKGKAVGGADRVILTEGRDAFQAGNRYGLPQEIWIDAKGGPESMWAQLWQYFVPTTTQ
jgi:hypothetical protein